MASLDEVEVYPLCKSQLLLARNVWHRQTPLSFALTAGHMDSLLAFCLYQRDAEGDKAGLLERCRRLPVEPASLVDGVDRADICHGDLIAVRTAGVTRGVD